MYINIYDFNILYAVISWPRKKLFNFVKKLIYDDPVKPAGLRAVLLQAPSPKNNMTYETNNKTI